MKKSVVIAAWKGEKYIAEQLNSILPQLDSDDEIIVSDDFPEGKTKEAVMGVNDGRIKYIEGPGKGVTANFENAMNHASGDIIFLCDQDDVWMPDKVSEVMSVILAGSDLVLHDAAVTDGSLNVIEPSYFSVHGASTSFLKNLVRNTYVGCCMAFTREVMLASLPMPEDIPMHDWWIALVAIKKGFRVSILNKSLIRWRRHGDNVTGGSTTLRQKIKWRINIIGNLRAFSHGKDQNK